ncbi:hypothetical protein [Variovorax sp. KK3]|uniref:hypothetical protein n=1 Tax=Variovorax sp. KK3 TaxID=1855728 RepID=UPI00117EFD49|nr:hypothetical protein [Variovorax sp. KK3]
MSLELLRQIASAQRFPVILIDDSDIERFRTLFRAGYATGFLQETPVGASWQVGVHVTEITPQGRQALANALDSADREDP